MALSMLPGRRLQQLPIQLSLCTQGFGIILDLLDQRRLWEPGPAKRRFPFQTLASRRHGMGYSRTRAWAVMWTALPWAITGANGPATFIVGDSTSFLVIFLDDVSRRDVPNATALPA